MPAVERALFLFDGPNFYKNLKHAGIQRGRMDYCSLAKNLALARIVVDVVLYTSPTDQNTDAANYVKQQKFFEHVKQSGVTLKLGHLVQRSRKCPNCQQLDIFKVEKSLDVMIAIDIVIRNDQYDVLYLVSCDSDLVPAVNYVQSLGKKVFLVVPSGSQCAGVGSECDSTIILTQNHIDHAQAIGC